MSRHRYTEQADEWLREHYCQGVPAAQTLREFEARFGWRPTAQALYVHCNRLGVRKERFYANDAPTKAVRAVRWCDEPDMQAWMEANDDGTGTVGQVSRAFAEAFGFPLSRMQVTYWRMINGRQARRSPRSSRYAVGDELVRSMHGGSYVMVKVAEHPTVPGSRDNWRLKHVMVWEEANGRKVPPETCIVFADRDRRNFDPGNLVAVPQRLIARLNSLEAPEWHDADSLRASIAVCELGSAVYRAQRRLPRACGVCGEVFQVPEDSPTDTQTCPACLAKGLKSRGRPKAQKGERTARCAVCGEPFERERSGQRRCRSCIDAHPKHSVSRARVLYEKEHCDGQL